MPAGKQLLEIVNTRIVDGLGTAGFHHVSFVLEGVDSPGGREVEVLRLHALLPQYAPFDSECASVACPRVNVPDPGAIGIRGV
jgi:hypothetical protein